MLGSSHFVHKVPAMVFAMGTALVISMILAPATLPNGSVVGLNARANAMDHWDRWETMDPFHMAAYTFGDFNCHQRMERTLIINGNEMPVCARDISIFVGLLFGAAVLARVRVTDSPIDTFMDLISEGARRNIKGKWKFALVILVLGMMFVPTALDGGVQMLSAFPGSPISYESTNAMRILTGFPMGIALGAVGTVMLMTLFSRRDDGETPLIRLRNSRS